ncbi:hypothetical protein ABPG72_019953 [Tetrahymena utriculariae]
MEVEKVGENNQTGNIPIEQRWRIIGYWQCCENQTKTAKFFGVSQSADDQAYLQKIEDGITNSIRDDRYVTSQVTADQNEISQPTALKFMKEIGLEYSVPSQIPVLNTSHIEKISQYAQKYLNIDEKRIIFTDESYFQLTRNKEGCWNFKDEDNFVQMPKQKICFMVWGAISWNDRSEICIRKSGFKLNSDTYIEVLDNYLLPFINKNKTQIATRSNKNGFYVVQDNAPCHRSKKTLDHLKQENISFLEHPPNS